jgi:hypothetical protein
VVPAGDVEGIELERPEPVDDDPDGLRRRRQRARRGKQVATHEEPARRRAVDAKWIGHREMVRDTDLADLRYSPLRPDSTELPKYLR